MTPRADPVPDCGFFCLVFWRSSSGHMIGFMLGSRLEGAYYHMHVLLTAGFPSFLRIRLLRNCECFRKPTSDLLIVGCCVQGLFNDALSTEY